MSWFLEQRMDWIDETLRIFGFINRRHMQRKFGISMPQAANDFREFEKRHPDRMCYDPHLKCYVANDINPVDDDFITRHNRSSSYAAPVPKQSPDRARGPRY